MYTVLSSVLVPRYTTPSVATNYISKQVGNTYQKFNMNGIFQIMLNDIMLVYIYACTLCNSVKIIAYTNSEYSTLPIVYGELSKNFGPRGASLQPLCDKSPPFSGGWGGRGSGALH